MSTKRLIVGVVVILASIVWLGNYISPSVVISSPQYDYVNAFLYDVSPTGYICGTTGPSPNIVELRLSPDNTNHRIQVRIRKCDGNDFGQSGRYEIRVNGATVSGWDGTYSAGTGTITTDIQPVAKGFWGHNTYIVYVYSNDQPTIPKHTGSIEAWEKLPTGQIFVDVPSTYWAFAEINALYNNGLTQGESACRDGSVPQTYRYFCPDLILDRAHMVVFLLRQKYGASYTPPARTKDISPM